MPPTAPTPAPTARADLQPTTGPVLSDYRIEDLRWAEMPPIDPAREQYRGPGMDTMARELAVVADAPPAPLDYRPAVAHTAAYATRRDWPGVNDERLGAGHLRVAPDIARPAVPLTQMSPNLDVQRNLWRFQPGPLRDQTPFTVGGPS